MGRHTTERLPEDAGLTLLELVVVVVIIGILASIAVPFYLDQRRGAWGAQAVSAASYVAVQVETEAARSNGRLLGARGAFLDEAAFDLYVETILAAHQGGVPQPVTYDAVDGTLGPNHYHLCFEHEQLTDGGGAAVWSVTYLSDGGGLQRPAPGPC